MVYSKLSAATIERVAGSSEGDRAPRRVGETAENGAGASQVRVVSVGDSAPVSGSAFKVYLTRVASIDTRQSGGAPQLAWKVAGRGSVPASRVSDSTALFAEMAAPGTVFSGPWEERKFLENPELTRTLGWRSVPDVKAILAANNDYAEAQLALHARYAEVTGLTALAQTVVRLREQLATARSEALSCVLCLGWGGGFVSKSAFLETDNQAFRTILRAVPAIGRSIREGLVFPKTRRVIFTGGQPSSLPGWTRLQFQ